jgi:hypothetical protein
LVARCGGATPPVDETRVTDPVVVRKAEHTAGGFDSPSSTRRSVVITCESMGGQCVPRVPGLPAWSLQRSHDYGALAGAPDGVILGVGGFHLLGGGSRPFRRCGSPYSNESALDPLSWPLWLGSLGIQAPQKSAKITPKITVKTDPGFRK